MLLTSSTGKSWFTLCLSVFFRGNVCCQGWFENLREKGEKSVRRGSAVKAIFCKIFYIGGDTCFISAV